MRVIHLCPSRAWGGAEEVATTLHKRALAHGHDSRLDLPFVRGESAVRPLGAWALAARDADLVHAHLPWPDRLGPALLAARGRPLVVTFHLLPDAGRWPRDRITRLPSEWMLRLAARRTRVRWVALSKGDRDVLGALLGPSVTVIRNAPPVPKPSVRPLSWPDGQLRVLSVGRLSWQKGYDQMLRALARPELRALPWHWNLIGDGEDRPALQALRDALSLQDRVSFVGAMPASEGLCRAELLLAPSRREGMPLVPLEAAESGVAVVASSIGPHLELYAQVPDALLPADPNAWTDALVRAFSQPALRASLATAQRALVGDDARESMFAAYEALYNTV